MLVPMVLPRDTNNLQCGITPISHFRQGDGYFWEIPKVGGGGDEKLFLSKKKYVGTFGLTVLYFFYLHFRGWFHENVHQVVLQGPYPPPSEMLALPY